MFKICKNCLRCLYAIIDIFQGNTKLAVQEECLEKAIDYDGIKKACITIFADDFFKHFGTHVGDAQIREPSHEKK